MLQRKSLIQPGFHLISVSAPDTSVFGHHAEEDSELRQVRPRATNHRECWASRSCEPQRAPGSGVREAGDKDPEIAGDVTEDRTPCE